MATGLYVEAVKAYEKRHPGHLKVLDVELGGRLPKCPHCGEPVVVNAYRVRLGVLECICPEHGLVLIKKEV